MLLADRVAQLASEAESLGGLTSIFDADLSTAIQSANLRYVLDGFAAKACANLVRTADGMFDPASELLRLPTETFWLEMLEEAIEEGARSDGGRIGVLVQAERDGRSGFIRHFSSKPNGLCQEYPAWTEFDFDQQPELSEGSFRLAHGDFDHLEGLLSHAVVHLDPHWQASPIFGRTLGPQALRQTIAEALWFDFPIIAAFSALLNSPGVAATRSSDLDRLNRARARRKRPPLLNHIEVRLVLGKEDRYSSSASTGHHRTPPRLHFVRGHLVHRRGGIVWRSPHLRGDTARSIMHKTVRVTAAASMRR